MSARSVALERKLNKALLGKEVIIRPESRAKGATVANARRRALEAMDDEEGTGVACTSQQSRYPPFSRCQEAFADLLAALSYPSSVTPPTGRVHKMSGEWEDAPEEQEIRQKAIAPIAAHRYRTIGDRNEKQCKDCGRWLELVQTNFRWKVEHNKTACWSPYCLPCERQRRRITWHQKNHR